MSEPGGAPDERTLAIQGLLNIRDLGGLRTGDGRVVASGRLIRSDNLRALTDEGLRVLLETVAPCLVIDLRTASERDREGVHDLGGGRVAAAHLPLEPQAALSEEEAAAGKATNLVDDYLAHLRVSGAALLRGFELLAEPDNLPAIVHCTAGKDRTGIFVALLLDLLGVESEQIVDDYAATGPSMLVMLDRIRASPFFQEVGLATAPAWIFETSPETIRSFLAVLARDHGGAREWGLAQGMSDTLPERLGRALLAPAG